MKTLLSFFIFFVFFLAMSCHTAKEASSDTGKTYEKADTAALTKAFANITLNKEQAAGMQLFKTNCNKCHPGGGEGKGPSLKDKKPSEFRIHWQVRLGFGKMPHFPKNQISKEELKQLVAFVRLMETTP